MATSSSTPEVGLTTLRSVETSRLIVSQPAKLKELTNMLEMFENINARVGERAGEGNSGDLGGGGGGQQGAAGQQASTRDQAIKKIPKPEAMRSRLENHVRSEMRSLEKLAHATADERKPGSACKLNEIYARIRRLNSLLTEILNASAEILQRLFVRVFIDRQSVI